MGYRSDVKAVFYVHDSAKEQWPALRLFVDENFPKDFKDNLEVICSSHYSGYVFSYEDVKWYDSWDDVKAFNAFVEQYTELIEGEGAVLPWMYEFIRVGEDYEDIETASAGNAEHVIRVVRTIESDF
jgi:hypothetical protein